MQNKKDMGRSHRAKTMRASSKESNDPKIKVKIGTYLNTGLYSRDTDKRKVAKQSELPTDYINIEGAEPDEELKRQALAEEMTQTACDTSGLEVTVKDDVFSIYLQKAHESLSKHKSLKMYSLNPNFDSHWTELDDAKHSVCRHMPLSSNDDAVSMGSDDSIINKLLRLRLEERQVTHSKRERVPVYL